MNCLRRLTVLVLLVLPLSSCDTVAPVEPPPEDTPRLVVMVVSDQFRYDYLERGAPLFEGGLARLLEEGVSFSRAHHGHAGTYTAPGHVSLATGAHPKRSGVVGNYWYERPNPDEVYCVDDPDLGTSPRRMQVSALGDWLKKRYPESKVYSVSGKDRGAVLPGGHDADGVYWFDDEEGGMVTSGYYADALPDWLAAMNEAGPPGDAFLDGWTPLPVDLALAAEAGFAPFHRGPFDDGFPHQVGGGSLRRGESYLYDLYRTPFLDTWVGEVALELTVRHDLGADEWPDLLALGFSAVDTVGHGYGPHSLEVLDTLLRLDRTLGRLFDHLDEALGRDGYVVAFSSDHGVVPVPEVVQRPEQRVGLEEIACLRRLVLDFEAAYGRDVWLGAPFYLDHSVLEEAHSSPRAAQVELKERIGACPHVERVWTQVELLEDREAAETDKGGEAGDGKGGRNLPEPGSEAWYAMLHRNSLHPERSPDVYVQWEEGFLTTFGSRTTHGSPYAYDTHVPLVIAGSGLSQGRVDEVVLTVDLAPTLAEMVGLQVPEEIDGRSLFAAAARAAASPRAAAAP